MIVAFRSFLFAPFLFAAGALAQQSTPTTPTPSAPPPQATTPALPAAPTPADQLPDSPGIAIHPAPEPSGPTVVFDSSMGRMVCRLYSKEAPSTVANFIGLAQGTKDWADPATHQKVHGKPLYDGTTFHRVIPGFMIQGGDPLGDGTGDPGFLFADEISPDLSFDRPGRLAMANSGPDTNGSQFFITEAAYPTLDGHYSLFGQCDPSAVSVVTAITHVERDAQDKPLTPVVLNKVTIVPAGQPLPAAPAASAAAGASTPQ
ncbi:peptidylprolyl isomerase [Acidipila sp. EB88]|uniref:peptidylprolyl isomerase n=1 Tax=Acidipila sp. EB88 TaxID=2305226 RepID=UPI000F5EF77D|nr:peptidylprolyl isomerase [Acidipila sp. EB88]RRA47137.1 peptidylprolyl isomerase [Acidipila sp. EB88]